MFVSSSNDGKAWSGFAPVKEGARSGKPYVLPPAHGQRYMKWRLVLKTRDARVSPKLALVSMEAGAGKGDQN